MTTVKQKLRAGQPVISVNPGGVAPSVIDALGRLGADILFIDCERTAVSVESVPVMARLAQAHGMAAIVRSPSKDWAQLTRYFDCGINGLVLPQVETPDECEHLVRVARYATKGREQDLLLIVQIESVAGLERLDAIAAAPGVDAVLIGPNDLAHSMGFLGDTSRPEVKQAVTEICRRLRDAAVPFGLPANAGSVRDLVGAGATLLYTTLEQFLAVGFDNFKKSMA